MRTQPRSLHPSLSATLLLTAALGAGGTVALGCQRSNGQPSIGPATPTVSPPASTAAGSMQSTSMAQAADGGTAASEAATYAELEGLYRELAGTGASPKEPWASLARQMAEMHQLMVSGRPMGGPGTMGGPGMMGGQGMGGRHGATMGGRGMMWQRSCALDTWNRGMATLSQKSGEAARSAGDTKLAEKLGAVAKKHSELAEQVGGQPAAPATETGQDGSAIFAAACSPCHRPQGEGVPGVFPSLRGDPVVLGSDERLIKTVLGGLNGPLAVGAQHYYGVMPAFGDRLDDRALAAVLTYVRGAWGNSAPPVTAERVAALRK